MKYPVNTLQEAKFSTSEITTKTLTIGNLRQVQQTKLNKGRGEL